MCDLDSPKAQKWYVKKTSRGVRMIGRRWEVGKQTLVMQLDVEFEFGWSVYRLFVRIRHLGKHKSV
jgi:hypothetical protein